MPSQQRLTPAAPDRPEPDPDNAGTSFGPPARAPLMLETAGWDDYALLDSGEGRKLERYGPFALIRPEPQALWTPRRAREWLAADAAFSGEDEDGPGRWRFHRPLPESWPMIYGQVRFLGRFTSFRHVGVFPEQAPHWEWMAERMSGRPGANILNLFGYTGLATLRLAAAGGRVTHVDASKKAIAWARENQALSGLDAAPIRWICDDAQKFVAREQRRGTRYDAVILDPPKFGRGPNGEVFDLFEHLPFLLRGCRALLSDRPAFLVLTAYAIRASFVSLHELLGEVLSGAGGAIESGELLLRELGGGRALSTSLFVRWRP